ncbi:MAG: isocitrate lyase/phosphoenolpyruvate mutase family protein, partial [Miltoncostaeaceae bacterium]
TADRNQTYMRAHMSEAERAATPEVDFRPFIIADADTGHGGDAHVRNLIRRFAEVGVPGYHIEDQKPGAKKCGHQGGKVLVPSDEQIKRASAARFQLDVMGVPGIIVCRTDAEAANLLDGCGDERDQPFILGVNGTAVPAYRAAFLGVIKQLHDAGISELNGHLLYAVSPEEQAEADAWLTDSGVAAKVAEIAKAHLADADALPEDTLDAAADAFLAEWEAGAKLSTLAEAVADAIQFRIDEGADVGMTVEQWNEFSHRAGWYQISEKAREMGIETDWSADRAKTPEGYFQIRGGIPYAVAKSLAVAPYADILWMETKTADLADAKEFADAIHA